MAAGKSFESWRFVLPIAAAVAFVVMLGWVAHGIGERRARAAADRSALQMARGHAGLLASELQKFRLLPLVLSEYPEARAALRQPRGAAASALNRKLELLAGRTDAAVIYVIGENGITVAASNWRRGDSFVGQNFGFRPYFTDAMRNERAELFALGAVSFRPGLFIAQRIADGGVPLGVIVVKVQFDQLEAEWRRQPGLTFVTDRHGVVIVTSRRDWRFRATALLDAAARAEIARALQFGRQPLMPLHTVRTDTGDIEVDNAPMRMATVDSAVDGGRLHYLEPLTPALAAAAASTRAVTLGGGLFAALLVALLLWTRVRRAARDQAWHELEAEVAVRTAELSDSNARLLTESRQRQAADAHLRAAQDELARANRLSSLGQITAGVAHEINQPVAAIRTIAENAGQFLERGNLDRVRGSLGDVVDMADRIGMITAELRGFASRGRPGLGAVDVEAALRGSLLMLGDRFRAGSVELTRNDSRVQLHVVAERIRLEQIIVNLLQNALDAVEDVADPKVGIAVRAKRSQVEIEVSDNGTGVDAAMADGVFTPFVTSKPNGLGLGLGIARDLAREFGGELDFARSSFGGAAFIIRLKRTRP